MKKGLFIEINYRNNKILETKNDVPLLELSKILQKKFLYTDIKFLSENNNDEDCKPTKENIINNMRTLIEESNKCEEIWIHYMGHSTATIDFRNEYLQKGLIPLDYEQHGFIYDDEIKTLLLSFKCKIIVFFDCCYGNYGLNLNYGLKMIEGKFINEEFNLPQTYIVNQNQINIFSMYLGSYKYKFSDKNKKMSDLLTKHFCQMMEKYGYKLNIDKILSEFFMRLSDELYLSHTPVFSSNKKINGQKYFFINLGNKDVLNLNYISSKSSEQLEREKEKYRKMKMMEMFGPLDNDTYAKLTNIVKNSMSNVGNNNVGNNNVGNINNIAQNNTIAIDSVINNSSNHNLNNGVVKNNIVNTNIIRNTIHNRIQNKLRKLNKK